MRTLLPLARSSRARRSALAFVIGYPLCEGEDYLNKFLVRSHRFQNEKEKNQLITVLGPRSLKSSFSQKSGLVGH